MTTVYKYRVYCNTDSKFEYGWGETAPTQCPVNSAHSINATKTSIVDASETNLVTINEGSNQTGGYFGCTTFKVTAAANSTGTVSTYFEFPISALAVTFSTESSHTGNFLDLSIAKDKVIGAITQNCGPVSSYVSGNYVVGDTVLYTDALGNRVYTCIQNTVSNELPTNTSYWILGYEISVSPTVTQNTQIGFHIKLDNTTTSDYLGQVIYKNLATNKIYVRHGPSNSYSAVSPTYVKQTIYYVKDYEIGPAAKHEIGTTKIGGASIIGDTLITVDYVNNTSQASSIIGRVEYLY
jgi:hypothetical protein